MKLYTCILLSILLGKGATAQPAYLLHKPYAAKYYYLDSFWKVISNLTDADAANQMNKLEEWAIENGDNELALQYNILMIRKYAITNSSVELSLKVVSVAVDARKRKNSYVEADALQLYASILHNQKKYGPAFENYLEAYNIYSKFPSEDFPNKREYLYDIGGAYYRYGEYDKAIKYLKEASEIVTSNTNDFAKPIFNLLGLCYRMLNEYDTSESYFRRLYNDAIGNHDTSWIGIAGSNIGINYFKQHRYEDAIPLLEQDIDIGIRTNKNIKNTAGSMNILAQIYFAKKDYNLSEQLLKKALALSESKSFWPDYQLAEQIYTNLYKIFYAKKDAYNAMVYADSAMTAKDSVASQFNTLNLVKATEKVAFAQQQLEKEQLSNQEKIQVVTRNGLIITILLLMIIGLLFINRQRLKQKELLSKKTSAENDLLSAQKQLDMFRQSVQEKNNLIEQFTNEITQMKTVADQQVDNETLLQLERFTILTDEQWEEFRILFEKVHKGFFNRLKQKLPDITPAEIRFLALSKLKLTPKEMASMLGISANSIRNYRLRLRRRLGLDEDANIEEIADAI